MPLYKIDENNGNPWAIWRITAEDTFSVADMALMPADIRNKQKQQEWLTGRMLIRRLAESIGAPYKGILKDSHGKPFLRETSLNLSLSHSFPFVAAYVHKNISVGIDLEQPKEKLRNVAPRIFRPEEIADGKDDIDKLCILWCAKEVLIKVHGKKDLFFIENMEIESFSKDSQGPVIGRIIVNGQITTVPMHYEVHSEFVVALNKS